MADTGDHSSSAPGPGVGHPLCLPPQACDLGWGSDSAQTMALCPRRAPGRQLIPMQ